MRAGRARAILRPLPWPPRRAARVLSWRPPAAAAATGGEATGRAADGDAAARLRAQRRPRGPLHGDRARLRRRRGRRPRRSAGPARPPTRSAAAGGPRRLRDPRHPRPRARAPGGPRPRRRHGDRPAAARGRARRSRRSLARRAGGPRARRHRAALRRGRSCARSSPATAATPTRCATVTIGFQAVKALLARRVAGATAFWNVEGVALRERGPGSASSASTTSAPRATRSSCCA